MKVKSERGSISLYVLIILLFVLIFGIGIYATASSREIAQIKQTSKIKETYNKDITKVDQFYNNVLNKLLGKSDIAVSSDGITKVNRPKLLFGMKPVIWEENNWKEISEKDNRWFDYLEQTGNTETTGTSKWANAMTEDGSLWVWIPRYEYQIDKNAQTININFIEGISKNVTSGYNIHPAFTNEKENGYINGGNNIELSGIWVSKFEAGFEDKNNNEIDTKWNSNIKHSGTYNNIINYYGNIISGETNIKYPTFKGNIYSYNNISIGDSYNIAGVLTNANNPYGLDGSSSDSHLMKNSEWGATVYLAYSKYGRNKTQIQSNNINFSSENNTIITKTGAGDFLNNQLQSSTANITGVYDLNGGLWEYEAAYVEKISDELVNKNYLNTLVDTNNWLSTKYKTVYIKDSVNDNQTNNYILNSSKYGDAISETSETGINTLAWGNQYSNFITASNPVFVRGGDYTNSINSGIFSYNSSTGEPLNNNGFRVVLCEE